MMFFCKRLFLLAIIFSYTITSAMEPKYKSTYTVIFHNDAHTRSYSNSSPSNSAYKDYLNSAKAFGGNDLSSPQSFNKNSTQQTKVKPSVNNEPLTKYQVMQQNGNIKELELEKQHLQIKYDKAWRTAKKEYLAKEIAEIDRILKSPMTKELSIIKDGDTKAALDAFKEIKENWGPDGQIFTTYEDLKWHLKSKTIKHGFDPYDAAYAILSSRADYNYIEQKLKSENHNNQAPFQNIINTNVPSQKNISNNDINSEKSTLTKQELLNQIYQTYNPFEREALYKQIDAINEREAINNSIITNDQKTSLASTSDKQAGDAEVSNPSQMQQTQHIEAQLNENLETLRITDPEMHEAIMDFKEKAKLNGKTIQEIRDFIKENIDQLAHITIYQNLFDTPPTKLTSVNSFNKETAISIDGLSTTINQNTLTITPETNQRIGQMLDTLNDQNLKRVSNYINTLVAIFKEKKLNTAIHSKYFTAGIESCVLLQKYIENPTKHIVAEQDKNILVFNARKNALESVASNPTQCREQSFTLTPEAYTVLQSRGIDPEQFTHCVGNKAQLQLLAEFVDILNRIVEVESNASTQPLFDLVITCTHVGNAYAQENNLDKAFSLADCAWAALDCAKAVCDSGIDIAKTRIPEAAEGMFEGCINAIYNTANMIINPRETLHNIRQSFSHLGECLAKFALSVPDPENQFISPEIDEIKAELRQEIMENIIDTVSQMTFKGTVSFATEQFVSGKIFCLGMSCVKHYADPSLAQLGKIVKGFKDKAVDKAPKFASTIYKKVTDTLSNFTKAEDVAVTANGTKVTVTNITENVVEHGASNKLISKIETQPSSQAVKNAAVIAEEQVVIKSTQSLAELRQSVLSLEKRMLTNDELKRLGFRGDSFHKLDNVNQKTGHIRAFTEIQGDMEKAKEVLNRVKKEFESRKLIAEGTKISETNGAKTTFCEFEDGSRVQIRTEGKSGHLKIDINDVLANTYEKITFK